MTWDDPEQLAAELAALPPLDNAAVAAAEADWLIDAVHPGAPLLITFSYVIWNRHPPFYLFGRSKKWEGLTGQPLNRVMLRDPSFHWYLYGVPGLGADADTLADRLRRVIDQIRPSEVWCVGDSMGAYAAVMFGFLLDADRIVAINPLSDFDPARARVHHESRFIWALDAIAAAPPATGYYDLPRLGRERGFRGKLDLVIGSNGAEGVPDTVSFDMMHAFRFGHLPGLKIHCVVDADHDRVAWMLHRDGRIDALLMGCLYDMPTAHLEETRFGRYTPRVRQPVPGLSPPPRPPIKRAAGRCPVEFRPLDANAVASAEANGDAALVDSIVPGAPLLICFGDAPADGAARFEWFDASAKLQQLCGGALNRILLRDPRRQWWLRGVPGIGDDCAAVACWISAWMGQMVPSRIVCVGNGMGAYAALMFAMLLPADHAIALNPLSLLDDDFARLCHDPRHSQALDRLQAPPAADGPRDLLQLAQESGYAGGLDIVYGSKPPVANWHSGSHNAVHAARLGLLPKARLHPESDVVDGALLNRLDFYRVLAPLLYRLGFV